MEKFNFNLMMPMCCNVSVLALFPSPLSIARHGSAVPLQPNSSSVWSRLRAMNASVSNFMSSTKFLPTKLTVLQLEPDVRDAKDDYRLDIERCASMPNMKQEFQSALLRNGEESLLCDL